MDQTADHLPAAVIDIDILDAPDRQYEIDWLVKMRTCEWCGEVSATPLEKYWLCREDKAKHTKHTKNWSVCPSCLFARDVCGKIGTFDSWIMPAIANMRSPLDDIIAVQPMNVPEGNVFYMDYVEGICPPPRRHNPDQERLLDMAATQLRAVADRACAPVRLERAHVDADARTVTLDISFTPPQAIDTLNIEFNITPEGAQFPAHEPA